MTQLSLLRKTSKRYDVTKRTKVIQRQDKTIRNTVEGRFGVAKRKYKSDRIFTKIKGSSEPLIALIFMAMNFEKAIALMAFIYLHIIKNFNRANVNIQEIYQSVKLKNDDYSVDPT